MSAKEFAVLAASFPLVRAGPGTVARPCAKLGCRVGLDRAVPPLWMYRLQLTLRIDILQEAGKKKIAFFAFRVEVLRHNPSLAEPTERKNMNLIQGRSSKLRERN